MLRYLANLSFAKGWLLRPISTLFRITGHSQQDAEASDFSITLLFQDHIDTGWRKPAIPTSSSTRCPISFSKFNGFAELFGLSQLTDCCRGRLVLRNGDLQWIVMKTQRNRFTGEIVSEERVEVSCNTLGQARYDKGISVCLH